MNYQPVTTTVQLRGKEVKVHALCTGTVAVKRNFRTKNGFGELAKINILMDKHYTEYMPIWVWVIEHPDGLMIVDTGESSAIADQNKYLAAESRFMRYFFKHGAKFNVDEKDELDHQMALINLEIQDVKLVVLTHLHLDHTDGLRFFPKADIIVGDYEYKHPNGNMPSTYPSWFKPNPVIYKQNRADIFGEAFAITSSEDMLYVLTPGHTAGHSSVIFKTDDYDILFAGDTSYNQEQVLSNELAGVNADYGKSKKTYKNLMDYAAAYKTIYLPSHDGNAGTRLKNKSFLVG
jgi:N-acyl homoserine lactone hydrolase